MPDSEDNDVASPPAFNSPADATRLPATTTALAPNPLRQIARPPPPATPEQCQKIVQAKRASKAPRTRENYRRAWGRFVQWCAANGADPLPAHPDTVERFLTDLRPVTRVYPDGTTKPPPENSWLTFGTLGVYRAAVQSAHRTAGFPSPFADPSVEETWRGLRRLLGVRKTQKDALVLELLVDVVSSFEAETRNEDDAVRHRALRDRAILLLGWALAARRSELALLAFEDVHARPGGLEVRFAYTKTDQEGVGQRTWVNDAPEGAVCAVRAFRAWSAVVDASDAWARPVDIADGYGRSRGRAVFRQVDRAGRVHRPLHQEGQAVGRIIKARCEASGLDGNWGGHSLRAGLVTTLAQERQDIEAIMRQSRHKTANVVVEYMRSARGLEDAPFRELFGRFRVGIP